MYPTDTLQQTIREILALMSLTLCFLFSANAQGIEWETLNQEVLALHKQGNNEQATALAKQSLRVAESLFGAEHPNVATSLNNLAFLQDTQGRYAQAEALYKRALVIREKVLGPKHPDVATSLTNLAAMYRDQGRYTQAAPLYKRSLAILEITLGPEHPDITTSLNNLALIYKAQGQYAQAELLYKRSLTILEKDLGPEHPDVVTLLNNLATLHLAHSEYALAEPLMKRILAINEKTLGPEHPDVATSLSNLAELYRAQGRYAQAEPLMQRTLVIFEKALGPEHPDVATSLGNLAGLYDNQGQYTQAEPLYKRSLMITEKVLGPKHPYVATILNNLAALYDTQGKYAQAEPLYKRALTIAENALGPESPGIAVTLNNLAALYKVQGQHVQAKALFKRSLAILEKALGREHPDVAASLNNLAALYTTQKQYAQALFLTRRASAIYRQRVIAGGSDDVAAREAAQNQEGFFQHMALLSRNPGQETASRITEESFQIVQLEQASGTAAAIAKMAARFARGDDELAALVKRKQDASDRHTKDEAKLIAASGMLPAERNAAVEQKLRESIAGAVQDIAQMDAELAQRFPEYQELTRPDPVSVNQIAGLLKPDEAMLVYALGDSSFLWIVKPDGAHFMPLKAKKKDVAAKVAVIRAQMEFDDMLGKAPRVSIAVLHDLYRSLFDPAVQHLAGVKHVILVPEGPLQSLPFAMLVATPPMATISEDDYSKVDWLARRYAISVLPSVSSIQAFRKFAKAAPENQEPFAGFGDPLIGGENGTTRGKRAKVDVATVFRKIAVADKGDLAAGKYAHGAEIADVEAIRHAPRLPESADELRAMGRELKGGTESIWLQERASEALLKATNLSKYRTLAFATHGVMAGEIDGIGEPGLILTPPRQGTVEDDGYLSAGEIAKLKLNADLVVLSACNTAAADGTPGAEGLSGLAKSFFYAGARSLLVSHWPVDSEATVPLTTGMLREYAANPGLGKAEAHRKAMMALMATPDHPEYAHPLYWAPFVVVGEGGAGTSHAPGMGRHRD